MTLWEFLAAPYAIVYLPLKPGREEDALLHLLRENSYEELIGLCVDKFRNFRDDTFPDVERQLSDADLIHSPSPDFGTRLGKDSWENGWEERTHSFFILDEWSETMPTDGVHVEPVLGSCMGTSEIKQKDTLVDMRQREATSAKDEVEAIMTLSTQTGDNGNSP